MLTFWGTLSEDDISTYAGTLILPSFMAHLERSPFRFAEQSSGAESICLSYTGEGRFEEYQLHPEKHALPLLQSIFPAGRLEQIHFRNGESLWRWSDDFGPDPEAPTMMRLYFWPTHEALPETRFRRFDPKLCHVSVTRMEIWIAAEVVQHYFAEWQQLITNVTDPALPTLEAIAGGFAFHTKKLGGEFTFQNDDSFRDLFRYCGLTKSLEELSTLVRPQFDSPETSISDEGLRFKLASVHST